jgi:hypothetical protein
MRCHMSKKGTHLHICIADMDVRCQNTLQSINILTHTIAGFGVVSITEGYR